MFKKNREKIPTQISNFSLKTSTFSEIFKFSTFFLIEQFFLSYFFWIQFRLKKAYLSIGAVCRAIPTLLSRFRSVSKNLDFMENGTDSHCFLLFFFPTKQYLGVFGAKRRFFLKLFRSYFFGFLRSFFGVIFF